jgi:hypothetical protein
MMVMFLNAGFIGIAALSIFPAAISEEKEDETLTLLRMTNLSALSILFGKSTSRFIGAMLLLAVQIPFTLLAITLGGITFSQIAAAYAVWQEPHFSSATSRCSPRYMPEQQCARGLSPGSWVSCFTLGSRSSWYFSLSAPLRWEPKWKAHGLAPRSNGEWKRTQCGRSGIC